MTGSKGIATAILKIQGMSDSRQARRRRRAALKLDGLFKIDINYILDSVTVRYDAGKLTPALIKKELALSKHASVTRETDS